MKTWLVILCLMAVVFSSSSLYAQSEVSAIESLRGLKGVSVLVQSLEPDIEADGLWINDIRTDVELKLRLAGLKVLTEDEWLNEPNTPYLSVIVRSLIIDEVGLYTFSIEVKLKEAVYLARDVTIMFSGATTWNLSQIGIIGSENVASFIRDSIKDLVNKFINDYLSVNPK